MMYDERFVTPMRQELTQLGVEELRTAADVDAKLQQLRGTALVVVNSVCGCAARNARPAVASALRNPTRPDHLYTVFAGQDAAATQQARSYFTGYAPSSPADRDAQGRPHRLHARALPDRGTLGGRDRDGHGGGVRQALRQGNDCRVADRRPFT